MISKAIAHKNYKYVQAKTTVANKVKVWILFLAVQNIFSIMI